MAPENDLNEELDLEMDDATVITVPIDDTLSNSGEAADAKAVGDALALKADASAITAISVNGETADAQGKILVNATEIPLSDADQTTVTAAIASAAGKTASTIPMSSDVGAPTISEAIDAIEGQTAATIPMETGSATTIAAKIGTMDTTMNAQSSAITTLQAKTGETIMIDGESTQTVKQAVAERVLTVNRNAADAAGNVQVDTVAFAENLKSELSQTIIAAFTERTSGGRSSVANSDGWLLKLEGNSVHEGFVAESIDMTVTAPVSGITATINRDTFVAAVSVSGTTTINYTESWSTDPATYGITVTGTPSSGDSISVVYVKEERGTITVSDPDSLIASGWNLYNDTNGYARAINYSDQYGFAIDGTYTAVKFSATTSGTKTDLTVTDKILSGFPDGWTTGYIWVTGGNDTDTAVWMTWEDWTAAYGESFAEYEESTVSLSTVMASKFPYGLLRVGNTRDELNISTGKAISRVERMAYSSANLAAAKATGRDYEYDEDYIYLVREAAVQSDITVDGKFTSDDHGLEWISGSSVGPIATVMYGNNLKNKLERDVVTKSQDIVDALDSTATDKALSAKQGKVINDKIESPTEITGILSNNESLTINAYTCHQFGKLIIAQVRFTTSASIASGRIIINGFPKPITSVSSGQSFGGVSCNKQAGLGLNYQGNGAVVATTASLPADTYTITLVYIAE